MPSLYVPCMGKIFAVQLALQHVYVASIHLEQLKWLQILCWILVYSHFHWLIRYWRMSCMHHQKIRHLIKSSKFYRGSKFYIGTKKSRISRFWDNMRCAKSICRIIWSCYLYFYFKYPKIEVFHFLSFLKTGHVLFVRNINVNFMKCQFPILLWKCGKWGIVSSI